ncbi:MAG: biopolymer transporter ExbD [Bacteroidia bacterium]|nr:biopolymer transporter ExbD [Bacteroidia bacterium]
MAEIIVEEKGKGGKKKAKKHAPHIDMTPMVDLMCLLITFFMLTTAFAKAKVMDIILPEKVKDPTKQEAPRISASRTLNIVLGPNNRLFWYPGNVKPEEFNNLPPLFETNFSQDSVNSIRKLLLERNATLAKSIAAKNDLVTRGELVVSQDSLHNIISKIKSDDATGPIVLIKAYKKANYGNFVDILDEMNICGIAIYMFVDIAWYEEKMVETAIASAPATSTN